MPCRVKTIIVLLCLLCCCQLCLAQYEFLLHKTYAQRYYPIDSLFFNKFLTTDSSVLFPQIDKLAEVAKKGGDEELALEAQVIKINYYYAGKQNNYALFEQPMIALKKIADEKKIVQLQIRTRVILSAYYFDITKQYGLLFENLLDAYERLKDIPAAEFPNKQEIIMNVAGSYYYLGDYEMARKYLHEAIQCPNSYKSNYAVSPINTLGLIFRDMGMYDSADHYFIVAKQKADSMHDPVWQGIASGNLGISYYLQKRYDEAIPLLELDVQQSIKGGEIDNALTSLVKLARINYLKNNLDVATGNMSYARSLINMAHDPYKHLMDLYPLLAELSSHNGNMALAYAYADSAIKVRDSMAIRKDAVLVARAEQKLELQRYNSTLLLKETEKKESLLVRNSLITIIGLIAVISILFISRQKLRHKQQQQSLEAEKQAAEQKLHEFARIAQEKTDLIEQISAELEKQTTIQIPKEKEADNATVLEQLRESTLLTDAQWEEFTTIFDIAHPGYIKRLKRLYPDLSPAETRYMVLSKLQLTAREMAGMLGISTVAIRQYRHRLRKKLMLTEDNELENLINNI